MKKLFFFLFLTTHIYSQRIDIKGKLVDKETNEPVVYANISFLKSNNGVSSDEDGTFSMNLNKKYLEYKVHISCLNYKDTIVLASSIQHKILYLTPNIIELDEVFLKKHNKQVVVNKIKRKKIKDGFSGGRKFPWIVTKFYPYNETYSATPFLKSIAIYYSKIGNYRAKYRLRFYKNEKGKPGKDLTSESIIVLKDKNDKWNSIDLYTYNLQIPKEGFFIGLERLNIPYNFQEKVYTDRVSKSKLSKISVSPNFGALRTLNDGTWFFQNGTWTNLKIAKHKDNSSLVPSISLTLSN